MAETSDGKKFVRVHEYTRRNGTKVETHDRSTPRTSRGAQPRQARQTSRRSPR
jgi:hypothetical protein